MIARLRLYIAAAQRASGLKAELLRGAVGAGALKILSIVLLLATTIVLARRLGPADFGQYALVLTIFTLLALPIGPAMQQLITRETAKFHNEHVFGPIRGLIRRANQASVAWSLVAAVLVFGLFVYLDGTDSASNKWLLFFIGFFIVPFLGFATVPSGVLRGLGNVVLAQWPLLFARPGLHLLIVVVLSVCGLLTTASALFAQVLATAFGFLLAVWLLHRKRPVELLRHQPTYRNAEWGRAWLPFTLLMATATFNSQIGILLLGWFGTDVQVAALRIADRGALLVGLPLVVINMVIGPHITRTYHNRNRDRSQMLSRTAARGALALALPIALPLIFAGTYVIGFVFGTEYAEVSAFPLIILAAAQMVNAALGPTGTFLIMSGYEKDTLVAQIIGLVLNIITCTILIPEYGATGAAYGAGLGLIVQKLFVTIKFAQRLKLRPGII